MWQYFKGALLYPPNAILAAAFGVLGFVTPSLWFMGLALEGTVLAVLALTPKFRRKVDAQRLETARRALIATLPGESKQRALEFDRACAQLDRLMGLAGDFTAETNRGALQRVQWIYLKLLIARSNVVGASASDLGAKIAEIEADLQDASGTEIVRKSKTATLAILRERLANVQRRKETLDEIESDLARIEAQVELMLDNAAMQGKPLTLLTEFELNSLA